LTAIRTFLVTPGAQIGRHLLDFSKNQNLPHTSSWQLAIRHDLGKDEAGFAGENIENLDGPISTTSGNILVIVIVTHTESRHLCITKCCPVCYLHITCL
jgi:hypothetical protein